MEKAIAIGLFFHCYQLVPYRWINNDQTNYFEFKKSNQLCTFLRERHLINSGDHHNMSFQHHSKHLIHFILVFFKLAAARGAYQFLTIETQEKFDLYNCKRWSIAKYILCALNAIENLNPSNRWKCVFHCFPKTIMVSWNNNSSKWKWTLNTKTQHSTWVRHTSHFNFDRSMILPCLCCAIDFSVNVPSFSNNIKLHFGPLGVEVVHRQTAPLSEGFW